MRSRGSRCWPHTRRLPSLNPFFKKRGRPRTRGPVSTTYFYSIIHTLDDLSGVRTPVVLTDHMIKRYFSRSKVVKSWLRRWYRHGSYTLQSCETVLFVFAAMSATVKVCFWLPMLPARSWDRKYQRYLLSCMIQNQGGSNWIGSSEVIVLRPHA